MGGLTIVGRLGWSLLRWAASAALWWAVGRGGIKSLLRFGRSAHAARVGARGFAVVDAIAEGARDRLELALYGAPFPAMLAVWRSDQPQADLTAVFDALEERFTAPAPAPALRALALR